MFVFFICLSRKTVHSDRTQCRNLAKIERTRTPRARPHPRPRGKISWRALGSLSGYLFNEISVILHATFDLISVSFWKLFSAQMAQSSGRYGLHLKIFNTHTWALVEFRHKFKHYYYNFKIKDLYGQYKIWTQIKHLHYIIIYKKYMVRHKMTYCVKDF